MKKIFSLFAAALMSAVMFALDVNPDGWKTQGEMCLALQQDINTVCGKSLKFAKVEEGVIYYNVGTNEAASWKTETEALGTDCTVPAFIQGATYSKNFYLHTYFAAEDCKFAWLYSYIQSVRQAQGKTTTISDGTTDGILRKELAAFFLHSPSETKWPASADYTTAGKPEAFESAWGYKFATNPVEDPVQYAIKYYCKSNPDDGVYRHIYSTDCADVFGDGTMSYDPEKNELTLNNYQVDLDGAQSAYPIMNEISGLKIILKGDNKLISGTSTALRLYATTTITGEGKLTATAIGTISDGIYISGGGDLTIDGCEVIANSAYGVEGSDGTLTITNGAKVTATGAISGSVTGWGNIVLGEGIQILSPTGAQIVSGKVCDAEGTLLKSEVVIGVPSTVTIPATSVTLDKDTLKMLMGTGTATLTATVLPENTTDFVEWSIVAGGESFVSVVSGTITALAEGEAKVVAKAGEVADTCVVVVGPAPVDYNITVNTTAAGNFKITSANCTDVLNDGGSFKFDNATKTITLTNCHFTSDTYPLTINQSVNIVLVGENSITSTISATALKFASGDATIGGGGKLTLSCVNTGGADGIYCPGGNLTINECEIYAEGGYGIEGGSTRTLTINPGAKVTAYGPNKGSFTGWGSIVLGEGVKILSPAGAQIVGGDVKDAEGALLKSEVVIGKKETPVAPESNGLNPYAYALSSEMKNDDVFTIHYSLNNNAVAGRILLTSGDNTKAITLADEQLWLGAHSVDVPVSEMPEGNNVAWSVEISGNSPVAPVQETRMYSMYCPHGVAVDTNPESEYFGRILATEAMDLVKTKSGYISSGANNGAGIYAFAPDFTQIMNGENAVFNGGLNLERLISGNGYAPMRVRISEDGRIFATSCDTNHVAVWELSKDLLTWTPVIAGNNDPTDFTIKDADGNFIAGLNASIDVKGQGEDLTLLLYSCDNRGIGNSQAGFRLDEYKLGTATTFEGLPTHITALDGNYGIIATNVCVVYDGEGGYWFGASRGGNAGQPNLAHINAEGVQDFYTESVDYYGGDGILIHNGMLFKGKARTNASVGNFDVYTIGKDQEGKPTLTLKYAVAANGIGRNLNDFAFDYAENLYAVGNSGEKIIAYAFPYSGVVITPAAKQYEYVVETPAAATLAEVLDGKTIRRAVASNDAVYVLAIDAQKAPTLVKADFEGNVVTTYATDFCTASTDHTLSMPLSDIALTADGVLVGCNADQIISDGSGNHLKIYKWAADGTGAMWLSGNKTWTTASDDAGNVLRPESGNFVTGFAGLTMAYNGTIAKGIIAVHAFRVGTPGSSTLGDRICYFHIDGDDFYTTFNQDMGFTTNQQAEPCMNAALAAGDFVYSAAAIAPVQFTPIITGKFASTCTKVQMADDYSGISGFSFVKKADKNLMFIPAINGVNVLNITAGLDKATADQALSTEAPTGNPTFMYAALVADGTKVMLMRDASIVLLNLQEGPGTGWFDNIETAPKAIKVIRDGQIYIIRDNVMYNMQGQIVR